jgi:preprotein translocase subunit SecF
MLEIIPSKTKIDFVGSTRICVGISIVAMLASVVLFFTKGLNYGIDFKGGAEVQLMFKQPTDVATLRTTLEEAGMKNLKIQALGTENKEFLAKMGADEASLQAMGEMVEKALSAKMDRASFEVERVDVVGPQAGAQLRKSGVLSLMYALLCIFIYVAIRFDSRYSPGAVAALIHDSIITIGVLVILQREFSLSILAAILTIIGYSINDTIIVFDRIRETLKAHPERSIDANVNASINDTLSRTILTGTTTMMVTIALMVFGSAVIADFALTMTIGILVGTYSSVFVASPIYVALVKWQDSRKADATQKAATKSSGASSGARAHTAKHS